jgi:hypothetical protein
VTSEAHTLVEHLTGRGVSFRLVGGKVRFRPTSLLTDDERDQLARVKDEVRALVAEDAITDEDQVFDLAEEILGSFPSPPSGAEHAGSTRAEKRAAIRGLTAKWSREFGYITIHDPTTGDSVDVATNDAPPWAKWEAGERKSRWRGGDKRAYDLTASEMEEIWAAEHPPEPELGIVEEHPIPE